MPGKSAHVTNEKQYEAPEGAARPVEPRVEAVSFDTLVPTRGG